MATQFNNLYAEFDALTGILVEREMTDKEVIELQTIRQNALIEIEKKAAKIAQRESALAKLEALGLDEDDLKALGL